MRPLSLAFTGENGTTYNPKPKLPPSSSMAPDFSSFDKKDSDQVRIATTISNWTYAARHMVVYSHMLNSTLNVPVTAFKMAAYQHARFDMGSGLWLWVYEVEIPSKEVFHVKLTADVNGSSDVVWRGYFSKNTNFENFIWFEGKSALNGDSGNWVLYGHPKNPSPWLSTVWVRDCDHGSFAVTLTIEKEGVYQNSFIAYEINEDWPLNRKAIISDTNTHSIMQVGWCSIAKKGRVKSETHFGDDLFHYWDETFNDSGCY